MTLKKGDRERDKTTRVVHVVRDVLIRMSPKNGARIYYCGVYSPAIYVEAAKAEPPTCLRCMFNEEDELETTRRAVKTMFMP